MRLDFGVGELFRVYLRLVRLFLLVTQPGHPALIWRLPVDQPHCGAHALGLVVCWLVFFSPTRQESLIVQGLTQNRCQVCSLSDAMTA